MAFKIPPKKHQVAHQQKHRRVSGRRSTNIRKRSSLEKPKMEIASASEEIFAALVKQIVGPGHEEVKAEFERLAALGIDEREAAELMALVLAFHATRSHALQQPFDYAAYLQELARLPEIDFAQSL